MSPLKDVKIYHNGMLPFYHRMRRMSNLFLEKTENLPLVCKGVCFLRFFGGRQVDGFPVLRELVLDVLPTRWHYHLDYKTIANSECRLFFVLHKLPQDCFECI